MFEAEELPAGVAELDAALADVKVYDFSHCLANVYGTRDS